MCAFKHLNSDWCGGHEPSLLPDVCWRRNVTHCKFYSLYNTLLGTVSAADFVFEPLWQLAGDRLTAHPLHKRQRERERNGQRGRPSFVALLCPSICQSCGTGCVIATGMRMRTYVFVVYLCMCGHRFSFHFYYFSVVISFLSIRWGRIVHLP